MTFRSNYVLSIAFAILALLAVGLFMPAVADHAVQVSIEARIIGAKDGEPIPDAKVAWVDDSGKERESPHDTATTDEDGVAHLRLLLWGAPSLLPWRPPVIGFVNRSLRINAEGFRPAVVACTKDNLIEVESGYLLKLIVPLEKSPSVD